MSKTAKEIMTPNPKFIGSGDSLETAIKLFFENNIHYAPVITPNKEVLGLLSEMALIKASLRHYLEPDKLDKVFHHKELFEAPVYLDESESIDDVVKTISKSSTNRLLVKNKQGLLVGIISPKDLLSLVSGQQKKSLNLRLELEKAKEESKLLSNKLSDVENMFKIYRNVFEESPYMMHSVNDQGRIIMANRCIHATLGYEKDELIGKSLSDIYPKTILHEAVGGLDKIKKNGHHHVTYTSMVKKNGEKIRIDIASSALTSPRGDFLGTISISRLVDSEGFLRALHGIVDKSAPTRNIDEN